MIELSPLSRPSGLPSRLRSDPAIRLKGLATALPPHEMSQDLVLQEARRLLEPKFPQFEKLVPSFRNAGVERRHFVVPENWFMAEHDWPERTDAYLAGAQDLFELAARRALEDAGISGKEVDIVVTVSSTGIATPTLDARAAASLGFRPDIQRRPLFGLGCAGGVTGLAAARQLAAAEPGRVVLMVAVEACSLSFQMDRLRKADIIATVLFGDGAAAAVLQAGGDGPVVGAGQEYMWPDTLDIMGWDVGRDGFGVIFDRSIPTFAESRFGEAADHALGSMGLRRGDVDRFVCHPGGAKVVTALETALDLRPGTLDAERDVLRRAGNMSAPTALFVLADVLAAGAAGQLVLCALGPGFTASFLPLGA